MVPENLINELQELTGELLEGDLRVRMRVGGYSMFPYLKNGDIIVVRKCSLTEIEKGAIVVFQSHEKWIAHRVIRKSWSEEREYLICRGDTCRRTDPEIYEADILGKVISFLRNGKEYDLENSRETKKGKCISTISFVRAPLLSFIIRVFLVTKKMRKTIKAIWKNILFLTKESRGLMLFNIVLSVLQGAIPFIIIFLIKLLLDLLISLKTSQEVGFPNTITWLLILTGCAFLANAVLSLLNGFIRERFSQSLSLFIYDLIQKKHSGIDMADIENPMQQDKIHRAVQEAGFRPFKLITEAMSGLQALIALLFILYVFIEIHWIVFVLLIIAVTPGFLVRLKFSKKLYSFNKSVSPLERMAYYFNRILTGIPFAKEIRLFGLSDYFRVKFHILQKDLHDRKNKILRRRMLAEIIAQIFAISLIFLSFAFVTNMALQGLLTVGTVVLFFMIFQRGFVVFRDLFQSMAGLYEDNIFLRDFFDFLELPTTADSRNNSKVWPVKNHDIAIKNLSFKYPSSSRDALHHVNMVIPEGKTVAIVGANGSGKTTLVKLLCGFYQPCEGIIEFGTTDINQINPEDLRKNITAVFQDFALYNLSALENIYLGDISNPPDYPAIQEAARQAGIHDVLEKLPSGYNNLLGNLFEKGEELSIGQWQKMAIAKAFYRNSSYLILDEPSSALDAETESQLLMNLKSLAKDKTVLIISHRLTSIHWADNIYFFENGTIAESGTHQELMQLKGGYFKMYETSKGNYPG